MITGAGRLSDASDDWKLLVDGVAGTIGSGISLRGGQGGSGVTEVGIVVTEVSVGVSRRSWTPQASETWAPVDFWHTARA